MQDGHALIHLPALISDLGVILATAALVTLLFRKLKQPVVLGYLLAGVMVGPHFPFFPSVSDDASIKVWAEIGVIFLLFSLGLEFSFKKLSHVGKSASVTALFEIVSMLGVGFLTGTLLGWSKMDSLFLGGILSISSTTIIIRAFDELNLKGRRFVSLVFGILIVEDIGAILLLVLLSTVAVTQSLSGVELLTSAVKLSFFLSLWFVVGIYVLPMFLNRVRTLLTDETALVFSIGLCLVMVLIATHVGFSPALGAFVMGSLIAETKEAKRIEHLILPVRDLFGAIFFVSVGMLIDPKVLIDYAPEIAVITAVTIVGKLLGSAIGALVSGQSLKHSVQVGMSLAQIGEFSFIIATLGLTLKVTSDFLYPIAVAVSAVTTFGTPYLIRMADPFYVWLEKRLPQRFQLAIEHYQNALRDQSGRNSLGKLLWKTHGVRLILNCVIVVAIGLSLEQWVFPFLEDKTDRAPWVPTVLAFASLMLAAPFLWAIVGGPRNKALAMLEHGEILQRLRPGIVVSHALIAFTLIIFLIHLFAPLSSVLGLSAIAALVLVLVSGTWARPVYRGIEERFLQNLDGNEQAQANRPRLTPWDASLAEFTLSADSELVGKTLMQSGIKEKFGVTVSAIERGTRRILAPGRDHILMPYDVLSIIGVDEQLAAARPVIESGPAGPESKASDDPISHFGLGSIRLTVDSRYVGKTIRDCGLRDDIAGLIVGVERGDQRLLSPDSSFTLSSGDLLWVVGELDRIRTVALET